MGDITRGCSLLRSEVLNCPTPRSIRQLNHGYMVPQQTLTCWLTKLRRTELSELR